VGLVHGIPLKVQKLVKKSASAGAMRLGLRVLGTAGAKSENQRAQITALSLVSAVRPAARHAGSRYNPITAADEKIPLPVVHVNNKPQYLVFGSHSPHPVAKHRHLPVESSKKPCPARTSRFNFAPNPVHWRDPHTVFQGHLKA